MQKLLNTNILIDFNLVKIVYFDWLPIYEFQSDFERSIWEHLVKNQPVCNISVLDPGSNGVHTLDTGLQRTEDRSSLAASPHRHRDTRPQNSRGETRPRRTPIPSLQAAPRDCKLKLNLGLDNNDNVKLVTSEGV